MYLLMWNFSAIECFKQYILDTVFLVLFITRDLGSLSKFSFSSSKTGLSGQLNQKYDTKILESVFFCASRLKLYDLSKSSFQNVCVSHHDLVDRYGINVTTEINYETTILFCLSHQVIFRYSDIYK